MNIQPVGSPLVLPEQQGSIAPAGKTAATGAATGDSMPAPREALAAAVKKLNESMQASAQSLEFSIDDDSKDIVVKVVDQHTREVLRQIPSKEALEIAKSLDKMRGLLIRQTA